MEKNVLNEAINQSEIVVGALAARNVYNKNSQTPITDIIINHVESMKTAVETVINDVFKEKFIGSVVSCVDRCAETLKEAEGVAVDKRSAYFKDKIETEAQKLSAVYGEVNKTFKNEVTHVNMKDQDYSKDKERASDYNNLVVNVAEYVANEVMKRNEHEIRLDMVGVKTVEQATNIAFGKLVVEYQKAMQQVNVVLGQLNDKLVQKLQSGEIEESIAFKRKMEGLPPIDKITPSMVDEFAKAMFKSELKNALDNIFSPLGKEMKEQAEKEKGAARVGAEAIEKHAEKSSIKDQVLNVGKQFNLDSKAMDAAKEEKVAVAAGVGQEMKR